MYSSIKSGDEYYDKDNVAIKEKSIEQPEAEPTVPSEEDYGDNASDKTLSMEPRENKDEGSVSTEIENDGKSFKRLYKMVDGFCLTYSSRFNDIVSIEIFILDSKALDKEAKQYTGSERSEIDVSKGGYSIADDEDYSKDNSNSLDQSSSLLATELDQDLNDNQPEIKGIFIF